MRDEFWILRPLILFSAGFLVLGIVLHACREAAEQRARLTECTPTSGCSAAVANCSGAKAVFKAFPPTSLPGATFEATTPTD